MSNADKAVDLYYQAWTRRDGDMSNVPLSDTFVFEGPTGTFESKNEFFAMAGQFGPAAVNFRVREQYSEGGNGSSVCSIVQWELPGIDGTTTAAEILTLDADGRIARAELLYDPRLVNKFLAAATEA